MAVLLAFHIPFLLHLNIRENIFNDFIGIQKIERLLGSIYYISHSVSMPFTHDQHTMNLLIIEYRGSITRLSVAFTLVGTRVNASRQTCDILRYSMINLYVID